MYYGEMESIYNLIPAVVQVPERPPRHISKHDPKLPPTGSTFNTKGSTVGLVSNVAGESAKKSVPDQAGRGFGKPPGSSVPDPANRLQASKGLKVETLSEVRKNNPEALVPSKLKPKLRPDVPTVKDAPVMNLVSSKNFIVANAVETILAQPKKTSEDAKDYLSKGDFGKTPKYLARVKGDIAGEKDYIQGLVREQEEAARAKVRPLDDAERDELTKGLKAKWEAVNKDYQAMAHLTKLDTVGKLRRKEQMESKLAQLEKDIEKLSKKNITIHADF